MSSRSYVLAASLLCLPAALTAQHSASATSPSSHVAPAEARQFDFLIGQWELTITPKATSLAARLHGAPRLLGTWKAWRAFDGWGIEDELRIIDASGNPMALTHSMRAWSGDERKWIQTSLDAYRSRIAGATATFDGKRMVVTSSGIDPEGKPYVTRMRFEEISAKSFAARQDRSTDGGKTWDEGVLKIEAKRSADAPPR